MNTDVRKDASLTEPPAGYAFSEMSEADVDRWDDLVTTARKTGSKEDWTRIGWMRNGYGMHLADSFAVDWEYVPHGGPARRQTRHTYSENAAWTASAWDFYQPLRQCEQEMMWLVRDDSEGVGR